MVVWEKGSDERSSLQCQKAATGTVVFVEEEEGRRNNLLSFLALNIFSTRWNSTPVSRLLNLFPTKYFCHLVGNVCMRESLFFVARVLTRAQRISISTFTCTISLQTCSRLLYSAACLFPSMVPWQDSRLDVQVSCDFGCIY